MRHLRKSLLVGWLALAPAALADEVIFKNGDKLTGTIVEMTEGSLVIDTAVAGRVRVKLEDVRTFSSQKPLDLRLQDGSVVKQPVEQVAEGGLRIAGGDLAAQELTLDRVKAINPSWGRWTGNVQAGGLLTFGNTQVQEIALSFAANRRTENDRITTSGAYRFGRQQNPNTGVSSTTTDNWRLTGQYDYFLQQYFDRPLYLFTRLNIERDRIADLDIRIAPSVGVGYQWLETPKINFRTEAGLGWTYEDFSTTGSNEFFSARLAYKYTNKLRDGLLLFNNFEYLPSLEDISKFNVITDIGLQIDMSRDWFAQISAELRHDSDPAPGARENDLRYVLTLGYRF